MNISDVFSYAFGAIKLRKLRAGLTTLGVIIGIAAIVALLSISQGLQITITDQLQTGFATDTLIVSTGGGLGMNPGAMTAVESDFELLVNYTKIIDEIENVEMSTAVIQKLCNLNSTEGELTVTIVGVDFAKYANIYSSTFVAERGETPLDPDNETVVVGKLVSDPGDNGTLLFDVNDAIEIIWTPSLYQVKTYTGHVTAVLKEIGGFGIGPSDFSVYIPISQAQSFFGTDECDQIIVQLENDDKTTIESVSEAIDEAFSDQVSVVSSIAVLDIMSSVFSTVELFLAGIAAISLLVAGIGIMNIMIVSLMERTREIGILKALGMKSRTVLSIFLSEAVIVGLMGAIFGIASGWVLANVVARVFSGGGPFGMSGGNQAATVGGMTITPVLTPTVLIGSLAFGVVISVVFAIYPAWQASRRKPVDALRYE
ncbi:MAG: ABC transporter permease [Candidatus Bathyarchaeota archaeon]|nr:ABC transporter permease [Candidatus Bathyarchaeota archaeon]MDH5495425.1 ABC transporter permease [Candidatus Bathyarchaeota archaeon]